MTYQDNGMVDEDLWKSDEWLTFYKNNMDLHAQIKGLFIKKCYFTEKACLSTDFISKELDKDPKFVHLLMAIWRRHFCSFYRAHGRIRYDTDNNLWVYNIKRINRL
uniref:Uncharacterized protein n=1 Tax=viral metagenome TaxID=1070528 RepID=A0A6C0B4U9_9ZZZZ|tara:strand:- start:54 stop:371 length:318 start_codon:yes stop_codon:yes gene_type:complete